MKVVENKGYISLFSVIFIFYLLVLPFAFLELRMEQVTVVPNVEEKAKRENWV